MNYKKSLFDVMKLTDGITKSSKNKKTKQEVLIDENKDLNIKVTKAISLKHPTEKILQLREEEDKLRLQSKEVRQALTNLEGTTLKSKYKSNKSVKFTSSSSSSSSLAEPSVINNELTIKMNKKDQKARENLVIDRRRLSLFAKENMAPIVPAQYQLHQFRQQRIAKMTAYQKQMIKAREFVVKAGEEVMLHTQHEWQLQQAVSFAQTNAYMRIISHFKYLIYQQRLIRKGRVFRGIILAKKCLKTLKKHKHYRMQPSHATTIITFKRMCKVFIKLKKLLIIRKAYVKIAQSYNREIAIQTLRKIRRFCDKRKQRQARLRWSYIQFLKYEAKYVFWYWYRITKKNLPRRKRAKRVKRWQHLRYLCKEKLKHWITMTRKHSRMRLMNKTIITNHATCVKSLHHFMKFIRRINAYRTVEQVGFDHYRIHLCGNWLLKYREYLKNKNSIKRIRTARCKMAIKNVSCLLMSRGLHALFDYAVKQSTARRIYYNEVQELKSYYYYEVLGKLRMKAAQNRGVRSSRRKGFSLHEKLLCFKGFSLFRKVLGKVKRTNRRAIQLAQKLILIDSQQSVPAGPGPIARGIRGKNKNKGITKKNKGQNTAISTPTTLTTSSNDDDINNTIDTMDNSSTAIARRVLAKSLPILLPNLTRLTLEKDLARCRLNLIYSKGISAFKALVEYRFDMDQRMIKVDKIRKYLASRSVIRRLSTFRNVVKVPSRFLKGKGNRMRRRVAQWKVLRMLYDASIYKRNIRQRKSYNQGRKLNEIYTLFNGLRRFRQRIQEELVPLSQKLNKAFYIKWKRLLEIGMNGYREWYEQLKHMYYCERKGHNHYSRNRLFKGFHIWHNFVRNCRRNKIRYNKSDKHHQRYISFPCMDRLRGMMKRHDRARAFLKIALRRRQHLAMIVIRDFCKSHAHWYKGTQAERKRIHIATKYHNNLLKIGGWDEFKANIIKIRELRLDVEYVTESWHKKITSKIFTFLKNEYHLSLKFDVNDVYKIIKKNSLSIMVKNLLAMRSMRFRHQVSLVRNDERLVLKGLRWFHYLRQSCIFQRNVYQSGRKIFYFTACNRFFKHLNFMVSSSKRSRWLLMKRKPIQHWGQYHSNILLYRWKEFTIRSKSFRRRLAAIRRLRCHKGLRFLHIFTRKNRISLPDNKRLKLALMISTSTSEHMEAQIIYKKNARYAMQAGYTIYKRRRLKIALNWLHHISQYRRPQRILIPKIRLKTMKNCFDFMVNKVIHHQGIRPFVLHCLNAWSKQRIYQFFKHWVRVKDDEDFLIHNLIKHQKIRGFTKLRALVSRRRMCKRSIKKANNLFCLSKKYEVLHYLRSTVVGRRVIKRVRIHHCHYALLKWVDFVKHHKRKIRLVTKVKEFRESSLIYNHWLGYFFRKRQRMKERRSRLMWIANYRKTMLRRGLQGFDIQVGRKWAIRYRNNTIVKQHYNNFKLKYGLKKILKWWNEEKELAQKRIVRINRAHQNNIGGSSSSSSSSSSSPSRSPSNTNRRSSSKW